jgi:hypothetical protein
LERVWLICSTGSSQDLANALRREYPNVCRGEPIVINDVNDPEEYYREVVKIHARLPDGWKSSDVIADYTGMTKHGSVGMVLACMGADRPLQYTLAKKDAQGKVTGSQTCIEIDLTWETVGMGPGGDEAPSPLAGQSSRHAPANGGAAARASETTSHTAADD